MYHNNNNNNNGVGTLPHSEVSSVVFLGFFCLLGCIFFTILMDGWGGWMSVCVSPYTYIQYIRTYIHNTYIHKHIHTYVHTCSSLSIPRTNIRKSHDRYSAVSNCPRCLSDERRRVFSKYVCEAETVEMGTLFNTSCVSVSNVRIVVYCAQADVFMGKVGGIISFHKSLFHVESQPL
jgi:hypothetical protein